MNKRFWRWVLPVILPLGVLTAGELPQAVTVCAVGARYGGNEQGDMAGTLRAMMDFHTENLRRILKEKPDLIVFSECIDLPRNLATEEEKRRWYDFAGRKLREYFQETARRYRSFVVYPHLEPAPGGGFYNTAELFDREGRPVGKPYRKQYLPRYEAEGGVRHGTEAVVWETEIGRIVPLICFDLNFDELLHEVVALKPDFVVFPSWYHGDLMQNYWAYRTGAHFIGAFSGEASVVNPLGRTLETGTPERPDVVRTVNPDCLQVHWDYNREPLARARAKYGDEVSHTDVDRLGVVLLSSRRPGKSAREIAAEFHIAPWEAYYRETVDARRRAESEARP